MTRRDSVNELKSANSLAFEHYLRTGHRVTSAEWDERFEQKFNPNHDPDNGRFTFGSGGMQATRPRPREVAMSATPTIKTQPRPTPARTQTPAAAPALRDPISADHILAVMPGAGKQADGYTDPLNRAMAYYGIETPEQRAAFLAQVSEESGHLQHSSENLNYSAEQLQKYWPNRFPTREIAEQYVGKPEAIANRAYAGKIGNGDEASGDGYLYRGRGILQITGRGNYRALGFEDDPDALSKPYHSAFAAAGFWKMRALNGRTRKILNRQEFDAIVGRVNTGRLGVERRWETYQRALAVLRTERPSP